MDWLKQIAPTIATAMGGPLAGMAVSAISKAIGVEPEKPPYSVREGGSRLCFVRDPDGYRIELIEKVAGD